MSASELPVLVRCVDARSETLRLLVLGQVKEDLHDLGAVAVQVLLEVADRLESLRPDGLVVDEVIGQSVTVQDLWVHASDQHVFVVGAVEDADPSAFGQAAGGAPEEVVLELLGGGLLETEHLTALRVHPGHDVADRAVLAGGVHALEDDQQGAVVGCVVQSLQRAELGDVGSQALLVLLLRVADRLADRGSAREVCLDPRFDPEGRRLDPHEGAFCVARARLPALVWAVHQSQRRRSSVPGWSLPLAMTSCP